MKLKDKKIWPNITCIPWNPVPKKKTLPKIPSDIEKVELQN